MSTTFADLSLVDAKSESLLFLAFGTPSQTMAMLFVWRQPWDLVLNLERLEEPHYTEMESGLEQPLDQDVMVQLPPCEAQ